MTDLLVVEGLRVWFPMTAGPLWRRSTEYVRAVDGISLRVRRGETLGLVGESGCGKSTTGLALLRLVEPTSGRVTFDGVDVTAAGRLQLRALRRRMAMVFQDPHASLNPRRTVGASVAEPLEIHRLHIDDRDARVAELFEFVGLSARDRHRYPHELSGGQAQRVGIARALVTEPDLLICDEPIAALDVSIQAQVLKLLERLRDELGLTCIFIAHDLSVVTHVSDRIAVMYLGRIVEVADRAQLVTAPAHPYTRALLSAVPMPDPVRERSRKRILLAGELPSNVSPPSGCNFRTRCPCVFEPCDRIDPLLQPVTPGQETACHLHGIHGDPTPAHPAQASSD